MSESPFLSALDLVLIAVLYLVFSAIMAVLAERWFAAIAVPDPDELQEGGIDEQA